MFLESNDYLIRRATKKDAKAIHQVLLRAFEQYRSFYSPEGFEDTVLSKQKAKERINEMNVYVAVDVCGEIIGTIGWQKKDEKEGYIRGMGVIPEKQGERSPAKLLLDVVENQARKQGCSILTLDTTKILKRAQNFYKKNGFRKTGNTNDFFGTLIYEYHKQIEV